MSTSDAGFTVNVALPDTEPKVAITLDWPAALPNATPLELTSAKTGAETFHCTDSVRSCELPSLRVPVAVNCWVVPASTAAEAGCTAIDTSVAGLTEKLAEPLIDPIAAFTVLEPVASAVAIPEGETCTADDDELQTTDPLKSRVLPLE